MAFDHDLAIKLSEKALSAVQSGSTVALDNPNDIAQTVISVLAIGLNAVPVIGDLLSAFAVTLSLLAFPSPTKDPWEKVRERVDTLVSQKIAANQLKLLQSTIQGFQANSDAYAKVWKNFQDAAPDAKEKYADVLRTHYTGFLLLLRAHIPSFQIDDYAAAALPMFAQVANVHLALLADGIKNGKDWGFPESHYGKVLVEEYKLLTSPAGGANARRGIVTRTAAPDSELLDMGKTAIEDAQRLDVDPQLIAMWKEAYGSLVHKFAVRQHSGSTLDYVSHVKKWYAEGRKKLQLRKWVDGGDIRWYGDGEDEGLALQTSADYDTEMVENVLNYAEFWPYLGTGKKMSAESLRNLDREIFRGPYIRYKENAAWSAQSPPRVTERGAPITAVRMCAGDNVREMQIKYGDQWTNRYGGCAKRELEDMGFELKDGEYITNVDIVTGHKLGSLKFITNLGTVYGPYGRPVHADLPISVNRTGYALTSMYLTQYSSTQPEGIEGIIFGFRPLLTAKKN